MHCARTRPETLSAWTLADSSLPVLWIRLGTQWFGVKDCVGETSTRWGAEGGGIEGEGCKVTDKNACPTLGEQKVGVRRICERKTGTRYILAGGGVMTNFWQDVRYG